MVLAALESENSSLDVIRWEVRRKYAESTPNVRCRRPTNILKKSVWKGEICTGEQDALGGNGTDGSR